MDDLDIEIVDDVTSNSESNNELSKLNSDVPTSNVNAVSINDNANVLDNNNVLNENVVGETIPNPLPDNTNVVDNQVNDNILNTNNIETENNTINSEVNNVIPDNNVNSEQSNEINIKNNATIKNEAGTQVIGELNNDGATAVSSDMPTNIDITMKPEEVKKDLSKPKRIRIKTKRDKRRTLIIIILLVVVSLSLGAAGYYFFYVSNDNLFEVKNVTFELGQPLPSSAVNYVETSKNIDDMEYNINLNNVISSVGVYNYSVDHKGIVKMGTITIQDTKGPIITLNDNLKFSVGSDIRKEDIVKSCEDPSMCTYDLLDKIDTSAIGSQEIGITAKDNIGNETKEIAKIEVFEVSKIVVCKNESKKSDDGTYEEYLEDTIYFDTTDNYVYSIGRKIVNFIDFGSYYNIYNKEKENSLYKFDSLKHNYSLSNEVLYKDEAKYDKYIEYYKEKGYTCESK